MSIRSITKTYLLPYSRPGDYIRFLNTPAKDAWYIVTANSLVNLHNGFVTPFVNMNPTDNTLEIEILRDGDKIEITVGERGPKEDEEELVQALKTAKVVLMNSPQQDNTTVELAIESLDELIEDRMVYKQNDN